MSIKLVQLNSVILLNISDVVSRDSGLKIGILLGFYETGNLHVRTSFELKLDQNEIDFNYLSRRLSQFAQTYPDDYIVGIYQIDQIDKQFLNQIQQWIIEFDVQQYSDLINIHFKGIHDFESYHEGNLIKTITEITETESVTCITIDKFNKYSVKSNKLEMKSINQHNQTLLQSLTTIQERIEKIIEYFMNPSIKTDLATTIEMDMLLVKLKNNLQFKQPLDRNSKNLKLQMAQLSSLTEQIMELEKFKLQIAKSILQTDLSQSI